MTKVRPFRQSGWPDGASFCPARGGTCSPAIGCQPGKSLTTSVNRTCGRTTRERMAWTAPIAPALVPLPPGPRLVIGGQARHGPRRRLQGGRPVHGVRQLLPELLRRHLALPWPRAPGRQPRGLALPGRLAASRFLLGPSAREPLVF